jgi:hypothetical protein
MPVLELFVEKLQVAGLTDDGTLPLDPSVLGFSRVLLRRLFCLLRVPRIPGAQIAYLDTGAPLTVFPHALWYHHFGWRAGRDFDPLSVTGVGATVRGQVLGHRFTSLLARLRVPVELGGSNPSGDRLRLDSLVCQLADTGGPSFIVLGLWGGAFTGRRLVVEQEPNSDDLHAQLEF